MRIGVPRETKEGERRVALLPDAVRILAGHGHPVIVEQGAGNGVGLTDEAYARAGATVGEADAAWRSELVVKVKELQPADLAHMPEGATIFSFHQLPREPERTRELARRGATAIAYEMLRDESGGFPILAPMSAIAGRLAVRAAREALGATPRDVLVLGAGHAGLEAARAAAGLGARVVVLTRTARSRDAARAAGFDADLALPEAVERHALQADLVVGAVFVPAQPTPKLLPRALVRRMKRGAMIADISIDAGGVAETSRTTTHESPTFVAEGVIHYGVPNIPAASPREAAAALSQAVLPYVSELASRGIVEAVRAAAHLRGAVLIWQGRVSHPGIAAEAGLPYTPVSDLIRQ